MDSEVSDRSQVEVSVKRLTFPAVLFFVCLPAFITVGIEWAKVGTVEAQTLENREEIRILKQRDEENRLWRERVQVLLEQTNKSLERVEKKLGIE